MFSLTEMEFLCGMTDPRHEDIKEEDELHDVNVIDLETSDDEVEYIETVITKGTPVPCKVKASVSQSNSPTLDGNPLHDDGFEEEDDKTDGIQKVQSEGSSKSVPSNGEEEQVELELPVKVVATCSKTLTASAAASADPIKFYGLDETRGEAEMIEAQPETEDQEMTECDRNRTVCISTTEASSTDLRSESTTVQLTFPPPSTSYNPPPLSQVLKPNTNTNADITFVYPVESGNEGPSSNNNLQSTFVKEAGDTVENLIPSSTSANLPCIGELVEKITNNAGATIPPKKDMKSAILSRGKPEAPVSQLKKGVPNCSPPKRFRTGGFQTPATSGSTQKPSYSSGSIPAPRMSWKKTPHAHAPVSKNLPPKKASGSFGPPKPTN
ncbi:hypothetical protein Ocin01_09291 [Orchesella cincta]|uniref:Uncharacterized protein n=1 Tax=Orchesella cincta TaxID=48709 RepID=A0A1D2MWQ4_ORCCI|nr:hypothetical protein Ocin01_09291 [Orchesella cincta]